MNRRAFLLGSAATAVALATPANVAVELIEEEVLIGDVGFPAMMTTFIDPEIFKVLFSRSMIVDGRRT